MFPIAYSGGLHVLQESQIIDMPEQVHLTPVNINLLLYRESCAHGIENSEVLKKSMIQSDCIDGLY